MKQVLTGILAVLMLLFVLCFPQLAVEGATEGLLLWFNQLVPSLLPCMILTQLLLGCGILDYLGNASRTTQRSTFFSGNSLYIAILGLLCGCPMGAKLTADFYRTGRISHTEALWLLCFSSQLSPAFLISFVAYNGFSDPFLQRFFLTSYYMSLGLYMLLLRLFFHWFKSSQSAAVTTKKEVPQLPTTPEDLDTSITYSLNAITRLGGYILLFTIAADGLKKLSPLPPKINCLVLGVIEITTGLQQIYSHTWPLLFKAILMSSCCAFGGLCGMMQVQSVLTGSGLPLSVYTIAKVTQALIAAACTAGLFLFFIL